MDIEQFDRLLEAEMRRHNASVTRLRKGLEVRQGGGEGAGLDVGDAALVPRRPGLDPRPMAAFLLAPQGSGKTRRIREALTGREQTGITTGELCELLGVAEGERGMATWQALGRELRALGWAPRRGGRGRERRYWPAAQE